MNPIDNFLSELGVKDQTNQAQLKSQITTYAFELAVSRLLEENQLDDAEKAAIKQVFDTNNLDDATVNRIFNTPERRQVLQDAFTEALRIASDATQETA